MTEIPDDVMKAAVDAVSQDNWTVDGDAAYTDPGDSVIASIKILPIARAILSERERCAKVADSHPNAHHTAIRDAILHPK